MHHNNGRQDENGHAKTPGIAFPPESRRPFLFVPSVAFVGKKCFARLTAHEWHQYTRMSNAIDAHVRGSSAAILTRLWMRGFVTFVLFLFTTDLHGAGEALKFPQQASEISHFGTDGNEGNKGYAKTPFL